VKVKKKFVVLFFREYLLTRTNIEALLKFFLIQEIKS